MNGRTITGMQAILIAFFALVIGACGSYFYCTHQIQTATPLAEAHVANSGDSIITTSANGAAPAMMAGSPENFSANTSNLRFGVYSDGSFRAYVITYGSDSVTPSQETYLPAATGLNITSGYNISAEGTGTITVASEHNGLTTHSFDPKTIISHVGWIYGKNTVTGLNEKFRMEDVVSITGNSGSGDVTFGVVNLEIVQ